MTQDGLHWKAMIRQLPDCICVWDYLWRDDARQGQKGRENISLSIMWSHVTAVHARAIPKTLMWIRDEYRSYNRHSLWLGLSFWNSLLLEIWRFFFGFPAGSAGYVKTTCHIYPQAECSQTVYTLVLAIHGNSAYMCSCVQVGDKSMWHSRVYSV